MWYSNKTKNSSDSHLHALSLSGKGRQLTGGTSLWWKQYHTVKAYYQKYGSYENVSKDLKLWRNWRCATQAAHKNRKLSEKQLEALDNINYPFEKRRTYKTKRELKLAAESFKHKGDENFSVEKKEQISYDRSKAKKKTARQPGILGP